MVSCIIELGDKIICHGYKEVIPTLKDSLIRVRVIDEIKLIPDHKLSEVYEFIHYFRIGLQESKGDIDKIMKFAGCWKDMSEQLFKEFIEDTRQRRKQAFSRRRKDEASTG